MGACFDSVPIDIRQGSDSSLTRSVSPSLKERKFYKMNPRFDLVTVEGRSAFPVC
jgi:hypothetical protein